MIKNAIYRHLAAKPKKLCGTLDALGIKRVVFETKYGEISIPVNSKSIIQAFLNNSYFGESEITKFHELNSSSTTLVNVGANVGTTAKIFQKISKYRSLICFEPDPDNFVGLQANCGDDPSVKLHNVALGSSAGMLQLNLNPKSVGRHSFKTDFSQGFINVPVTTLDQCLAHDDQYDLYMDVEGWEIEVLKGAKSVLQNCQLCALEWNGQLHEKEEKAEAQTILSDAGFTGFAKLNDLTVWFELADLQDIKVQSDIVFFREPLGSNLGKNS